MTEGGVGATVGDEGRAPGVHAGAPDVFVSYASQDAAVAAAVTAALESQGLKCWIAPRDVTPGEFYADAIVGAINATRVLVLVLTGNAVASTHILREVERASAKRHPVVSFRIDAVPLPAGLEYFLSASHWMDATTLGVERALPKLVEAVRSLVAPVAVTDLGLSAAAANAVPKPLKRLRLSRPLIVLGAVVALALAYIAADKFWLSRSAISQHPVEAAPPAATPSAPTISKNSIAVLPFTDMSEKKDQEYFADGMAEEIINLLAKVPELYVPARTSSFYFKGKPTRIADIARELGVTHILEGSIRKSGNRLRLTAQLIRADNGYHVWSETYDRDFRDVFKVQDEIANAVVQALQISLMGGPLTRQQGGTENLEAYQLYLHALDAIGQNTRASLQEARTDLEQAVKLDPAFGLAGSTLSMSYQVAADNGFVTTQEGYERSRTLALQALKLSPDLSNAHAALSLVKSSYDWDWPGAEMEGRRALALNPANNGALYSLGQAYAVQGRWEDADPLLRRAIALDPLSPWRHLNLAIELYSAGRYPEAEAEVRKVLELAPNFISGHFYLAKTLLAEGRAPAALAAAEQEADEENRLEILPIALQAVGRKADADEALRTLSARFANDAAFYIAMVYAYRGSTDQAFDWLDRAYRQKDIGLPEIVGEPLLRNLANDPRYKAFLRKMKLE